MSTAGTPAPSGRPGLLCGCCRISAVRGRTAAWTGRSPRRSTPSYRRTLWSPLDTHLEASTDHVDRLPVHLERSIRLAFFARALRGLMSPLTVRNIAQCILKMLLMSVLQVQAQRLRQCPQRAMLICIAACMGTGEVSHKHRPGLSPPKTNCYQAFIRVSRRSALAAHMQRA